MKGFDPLQMLTSVQLQRKYIIHILYIFHSFHRTITFITHVPVEQSL